MIWSKINGYGYKLGFGSGFWPNSDPGLITSNEGRILIFCLLFVVILLVSNVFSKPFGPGSGSSPNFTGARSGPVFLIKTSMERLTPKV